MALVRFGGGVSEIRGSIAGQTFSRNRGGSYIRNRTKPINAPTVPQSEWRSTFTGLMVAFSGLTPDQKVAWNTLAETVTRKNKLGESYTPSGVQLFMQNNLNLAAVGGGVISVAPVAEPTTAPNVSSATYEATSLAGLLSDFKATLDSTGSIAEGYTLEASAPFSDRKSSSSVGYKQVAKGSSFSDVSILDGYTATYTDGVPEGAYIWLRARAVDSGGFGGPWLYSLIQVTGGD